MTFYGKWFFIQKSRSDPKGLSDMARRGGLAAARAKKREKEKRGECKDCGKSTFEHPGDYYMLKVEMWNKYADGNSIELHGGWSEEKPSGFLCMRCLEKRMGRKLLLSDLMPECPANNYWFQFFGESKVTRKQII